MMLPGWDYTGPMPSDWSRWEIVTDVKGRRLKVTVTGSAGAYANDVWDWAVGNVVALRAKWEGEPPRGFVNCEMRYIIGPPELKADVPFVVGG